MKVIQLPQNRLSRPANLSELRMLALQIAHEQFSLFPKESGHSTVVEWLLRQWATSASKELQQAFMRYAYGDPSTLRMVNDNDVAIHVHYEDEKAA